MVYLLLCKSNYVLNSKFKINKLFYLSNDNKMHPIAILPNTHNKI
jgi:hypothetical protein